MCMSRVTYLAPEPEPGTFLPPVKRWKWITRDGGDFWTPLTGGHRCGTWHVAENARPMDEFYSRADIGWHVFPTYEDAMGSELRPDRYGSRMTELVLVDVAGLIAQGIGDGLGAEVPVETYRMIRVPKLSLWERFTRFWRI